MRGQPCLSLALVAAAALAAGPASALAPPAAAAHRSLALPAQLPGGNDAVEALRRAARSKAAAGRFADAIGDYERLLAIGPGDSDALAHIAQLQAWSGNYDKAIVFFRDTIALHPLDLGLQSDLADVLTWANRLEEAERLYEQVLARNPHHHESLKGLARARLLRGDTASAAAVIDRAFDLYPKDVDLHVERARMLSQEGRLDEAVQALQRAAELAPSNPDVVRHLAETYQQKRDWANAQGAWLRFAQLVPDDAESHVALGRVYLALGKLSLAREHASLALRMNPTGAAANQLNADLEREARLAPARKASDWLELLAYAVVLPVTVLVVRRSRRRLRRRPAAWTFAAYVVPGFLVLGIVAHSIEGIPWSWFDARVFTGVSDVVLLLGLGVAFVAALRREPKVREFEGDVVLALGAHPDDIELGCGGLILKLKASGARVYGLTMTRGEKGTDRPEQRESEARRAAGFLGLDGHWILDFPDTSLQEKIPLLKEVIETKIKELGATMVLTHTDVDVHGDHRAIFAATREAARSVRTVLCYEDVSTTDQFTPNFYVDITHYIDDHLRACALHRTQEHRTYMDPQVIQGRAAHRGMQIGVRFAMAFRTLNMVR
ncbi:MAG TPA: PIG-L family deacetylase [Myxococcales bacterium]|nr:PIG-L family deacetylase [Myxococcales bacterium]